MIAGDFDVIGTQIAPMKNFLDIYLPNCDLSENESESDDMRSTSCCSTYGSVQDSSHMELLCNLSCSSDAEQGDFLSDDAFYPVFDTPFQNVAADWTILQASDVMSNFEQCENVADQKGMLSVYQKGTVEDQKPEKSEILKAILEGQSNILRNQRINFFSPTSSIMDDGVPRFDVEDMEHCLTSPTSSVDSTLEAFHDEEMQKFQPSKLHSSQDPKKNPKIKRKKRKYERRATARKNVQLYQFMLRLLDEKDECVSWVSREEGVFRLLKSKKVADMWGKYKKNENMTYESLSRALRHYYAQEILLPVPKKLHYKFCKKTLEQWYTEKSS